jgi:predicted glycoside hydrolase/deacetylase ChbG (UPF0249 family)
MDCYRIHLAAWVFITDNFIGAAMIIINADDWGRSRTETNAALSCYRKGRITSVSAMVFMEDSDRAADLAKETGIDVGLHLNLTQSFSGEVRVRSLKNYHDRIVRYLSFNKYAFLIYNPVLRNEFKYVYQAQFDEFVRLYGKPPTHIDGHHHQHLGTNMLLDRVIPAGEKVRRNFYFWPGEKGLLNRTYRRMGDLTLTRRYRTTDYFFALSQCIKNDRMNRVTELARTANVEIMTHPANAIEHAYLMSDDYLATLGRLEKGTYLGL